MTPTLPPHTPLWNLMITSLEFGQPLIFLVQIGSLYWRVEICKGMVRKHFRNNQNQHDFGKFHIFYQHPFAGYIVQCKKCSQLTLIFYPLFIIVMTEAWHTQASRQATAWLIVPHLPASCWSSYKQYQSVVEPLKLFSISSPNFNVVSQLSPSSGQEW